MIILQNTVVHFSSMLAAAALMTSVLSGCGDSDAGVATAGGGDATAAKSTYVLVHGAFAGGWAWDRMVPLLEARGHAVVTLDLPAHGTDETPTASATLQGYTDAVVEVLDSASQPVILVGHSMGGIVVSQAAEARPDKVNKLVYLAAILIDDGQSLFGDAAAMPDTSATLGSYFEPSVDGLALRDGWIENAFCPDCSTDDMALIKAHQRLEPLDPLGTPIHVTQEKWGSVPRVYIETLQDLSLGTAKQRAFYNALPCEKVISTDSGHCPFLTKPDELSTALLAL